MLLALIRKELLALVRDPHALAALFLMPAAFIVIMSLALQNLYAPACAAASLRHRQRHGQPRSPAHQCHLGDDPG
jgi:hypothetical protein